MKYWILILSILALSAFVYADNDHPYYNYSDDHHYSGDFQQGYSEGYNHGLRDRSAGLNFDFRHSDRYSNGDSDFRSGYAEGYSDGFFNRGANYNRSDDRDDYYRSRNYSDRDRDYDRDGRGGYYRSGAVTVYTHRGFSGSATTFSVGQYPYLNGRFNDSIESIRVSGDVRVILFDDANFRGRRVVLDRNAWDLGGFRRKAASMIIEPIRYGYMR